MSSRRNKPSTKQNFLKRRSYEAGRTQVDAAHRATQRLYCDTLEFWRRCSRPPCRRHRRCCGEASRCLMRGLIHVPPSQRRKAHKAVIAGGPRRLPPRTHFEWIVRRADFSTVVTWGLD
jgi:hypothetical protein